MFNRFKKKRFILVGILDDSVYSIHVERDYDSVVVLDRLDEFYVNRDSDAFNYSSLVIELVRRLKDSRIKTKDVMISYNSQKTLDKFIQVFDMSEKEIDEHIVFEYEDHFKGRDRDQFVFDYEYVGKTNYSGDTKVSLNIVSVPRFEVDSLVKSFSKNGYNVHFIDEELNSIKNIVGLSEVPKVLIHIGKYSLHVSLYVGGELVFCRRKDGGYRKLKKSMDVNGYDNLKVDLMVGSDTYNQLSSMLTEIQESISYLLPNYEIDEYSIEVYYLNKFLDGICDLLGSSFDVDTCLFNRNNDRISFVNSDGREIGICYSSLLGLMAR